MAGVETPIAHEKSVADKTLVGDFGEHAVQPGNVFGRGMPRGFLGDCTLHEGARTQDLERPFDRSAVGDGRCRLLLDDVDAGADTDLQPPLDLQRDQGLAHGRTRDAELRCQLPLRRQPASNRKLALIDQKPQLIGNSPIKPARFNGLERQDLLLARVPPKS